MTHDGPDVPAIVVISVRIPGDESCRGIGIQAMPLSVEVKENGRAFALVFEVRGFREFVHENAANLNRRVDDIVRGQNDQSLCSSV